MLSLSSGAAATEASLRTLRGAIEVLSMELEQLTTAGQGGTYAPGAVKSEITTHSDNVRIWDGMKRDLSEAKAKLAEAKGAKLKEDAIKNLESKVAKMSFSSDNLRDIILRQQSIRGFYTAPSTFFKSKKAELKQLKQELEFM